MANSDHECQVYMCCVLQCKYGSIISIGVCFQFGNWPYPPVRMNEIALASKTLLTLANSSYLKTGFPLGAAFILNFFLSIPELAHNHFIHQMKIVFPSTLNPLVMLQGFSLLWKTVIQCSKLQVCLSASVQSEFPSAVQ